MNRRTSCFCESLAAQGVRYDSSIFPLKTPLYGESDSPLYPYWEGQIFRVPVTMLALGPLRVPFASGAFFRLAPLGLIRFGLWWSSRRGQPRMLVLHPRELDPAHPRLPLKGWERAVHYAKLETTLPKLECLLKKGNWVSISEAYRSELDTPREALENNKIRLK